MFSELVDQLPYLNAQLYLPNKEKLQRQLQKVNEK
jgi:hypothetical protein